MAWTSPLPERYLSVCWPLQHQRPLQSYQIFFTLKMFHWTNSPATNQSFEATSQPQIGIASTKPKMEHLQRDRTKHWQNPCLSVSSRLVCHLDFSFQRERPKKLPEEFGCSIELAVNRLKCTNKITNKFTKKVQQVHSHLKYQSEKTERLWIPVSRLAIFLINWKYRQQHCSNNSLDTQILVGVQCNTKMQLPANPTNGLTKPLQNWVDDHPLYVWK